MGPVVKLRLPCNMYNSEKLCLKWNDFQENVSSAFGKMREDEEFADVTLACEDGQQVEAHSVILASCIPFFSNIFKRNKHPHPLIYMSGLTSEDLVAIVDFIYYGEANIKQDNLDSFLAVAEELKLPGLTGNEQLKEPENKPESEPYTQDKRKYKKKVHTPKVEAVEEVKGIFEDKPLSEVPFVNTEAISKVSVDELESTILAMVEKTEHGLYSCSVCGKTDSLKGNLKNHIEAKHIEGISFPCGQCGKQLRSRNAVACHINRCHRK